FIGSAYLNGFRPQSPKHGVVKPIAKNIRSVRLATAAMIPKSRLERQLVPVLLLVVLLLVTARGVAETTTNTIENSVVKVFSTARYPDPYQPWTKRAPYQVTGSGVIIRGKRYSLECPCRSLCQPGASSG